MNEKSKNFKNGIGVLLFYFVCMLLPIRIIPFYLLGIEYTEVPLWIRAIYSFLFEAIQLGIIIFLLRNQLKKDLTDLKRHHKEYFSKYFKYWFLLLGLMMISNLLINLATPNNMANNEESIREMFQLVPIYTFITSVFIAPLLEELVFRRSIRNVFSNNICFICVSGLLFGSLHVITSLTSYSELLYIIPYSIPGFIFAYLLLKTDNVLVPASMHFLHNGVLMSLQMLFLLLG